MEGSYKPPFFLFSPHLETIFPAIVRRVDIRPYVRERITTPDEDFLDLDWLKNGSDNLVIISHGLEGNSQRGYVKGMAKMFSDRQFDVLAWNYRGCSEEMNRKVRFYHSGATDDLGTVINHAADNKKYKSIFLVGFSLGGNITLKYLGESQPRAEVRKAVAISVPMDLRSSCEKISRRSNWIYANRFLKSLKSKIIRKSRVMEGIDITGIGKIRTLKDFDDRYTAPLHGFTDALDYYRKCSSVFFVGGIKTPTLIVNTRNDPFLSDECFPLEAVKSNPYITFETLTRGGHVGFTQFNKNGLYWSEQRALAFFTS